MFDEIDLTNAILFIDGSAGQYVPQRFIHRLNRDAVTLWGMAPASIDECFELIEGGPEGEYYWDAWHDIITWLTITSKESGRKYRLYQDGDLWLVPIK